MRVTPTLLVASPERTNCRLLTHSRHATLLAGTNFTTIAPSSPTIRAKALGNLSPATSRLVFNLWTFLVLSSLPPPHSFLHSSDPSHSFARELTSVIHYRVAAPHSHDAEEIPRARHCDGVGCDCSRESFAMQQRRDWQCHDCCNCYPVSPDSFTAHSSRSLVKPAKRWTNATGVQVSRTDLNKLRCLSHTTTVRSFGHMKNIQLCIQHLQTQISITMSKLGYGVPNGRLPTLSTSTSEPNFPKKRKGKSSRATVGHSVEAGRPLTKEERELRRDSWLNVPPEKTFEEQQAEEKTFGHLGGKIRRSGPVDAALTWFSWTGAWIKHTLMRINDSFEQYLAPEAAANALATVRTGSGHIRTRSLYVTIILLLLTFGSLWTLVNYLLEATRASAQCNASTVYYPVTYTYTTSVFVDQTVCPGVAAESAQQPDPPSPTTTRTATSTFFSTTTVFATPGDSSSSVADPASTTPFMFSANSGTTSWINGNSPSSGVSLVVATTTIEVPADPPSTSHDPPSTSSDPRQLSRTLLPFRRPHTRRQASHWLARTSPAPPTSRALSLSPMCPL